MLRTWSCCLCVSVSVTHFNARLTKQVERQHMSLSSPPGFDTGLLFLSWNRTSSRCPDRHFLRFSVSVENSSTVSGSVQHQWQSVSLSHRVCVCVFVLFRGAQNWSQKFFRARCRLFVVQCWTVVTHTTHTHVLACRVVVWCFISGTSGASRRQFYGASAATCCAHLFPAVPKFAGSISSSDWMKCINMSSERCSAFVTHTCEPCYLIGNKEWK